MAFQRLHSRSLPMQPTAKRVSCDGANTRSSSLLLLDPWEGNDDVVAMKSCVGDPSSPQVTVSNALLRTSLTAERATLAAAAVFGLSPRLLSVARDFKTACSEKNPPLLFSGLTFASSLQYCL